MIEPLLSRFSFVVVFFLALLATAPCPISAIILLLPRPGRAGACALALYGQMKELKIFKIQINE